jgi:hypothetical protein
MLRYLILGLLFLSACANNNQSPDAVAVNRGCYGGYGRQTCQVTFADGQPGVTGINQMGQPYFCKGPGAL